MPRIKLTDATDSRVLFGKEIKSLDKIYFVSDIDKFDSIVNERLLAEIAANKYELVVFLGNTLSFLDSSDGAPLGLAGQYDVLYDVFLSKKPVKDADVKERAVCKRISDYLLRDNSEEINTYYSFAKKCKSLKVPIIYFTGSRDSILNRYQKDWFTASNKIPIVRKIKEKTSVAKRQGNVYYPSGDFELIRLNDDLYLFGINAAESGEYPLIGKLAETQDPMEKPERIVLVSYAPGTEKYRKIGAKEILDLKRKLKFRFHIHGHCDKYYGVYIGENKIPTKSAHFE